LILADNRYSAPFGLKGSNPIDNAVVDKLLTAALARGGDYADLFFEYSVSGSYNLDEGILKSAGRSVSLGVGVRVMKGDATGYAYVQNLELDAMLVAASTAARIASELSGIRAPAVDVTRIPARYRSDQLSLELPGIDKRELLLRADRAARAEDARVIRVEASFSEQIREIMVATSRGRLARDRQPLIRFGVQVIAEHKGKFQSGSSGGGGRVSLGYFDQRSPEWHAKEAVRHALVMLDARESPAGEMSVVLSPGDSGILLHEAVGHGLEADFNRKGTSNYSGRIGQKVASGLCTVVDDATFADARGSINVDDEGHSPDKTVLIERGVLRGYLHDQYSAAHFHADPSGNGRRESFQSHPLPRMTNTVLMNGSDDPEDIIRSVKRGVYARKFGGGQVDISNGDFVFSLTEGYLIEDGKLTAPIKGANLIGNGPETMDRVTMLGNDLRLSDGVWTCGKDGQSVPVGVGCPTVKIAAMTVGGTQMGRA
jgi:TldD protein